MLKLTRKISLFLIISSSFLSGGIKIKGRITNIKTGNPVTGVNISVEKLGIGTISDDTGNFEIRIHYQDKIILEFNHIAYEPISRSFTDSKSDVIIRMNEVLLQMDDVVVTSMRNSYLLRDVPINTEVIGKKEIKESGVLTVSGLLDQL